MKKVLLAITCCIALLACNNETKTAENSDSTVAPAPPLDTAATAAQDAPAHSPDANTAASTKKGEALVAKSDCLTCHKPDQKVVGPSYKDVAQKYTEADVDKLANKIIQGGAGSWGEVPMTPHPDLSKDDATEMVKYILSLK